MEENTDTVADTSQEPTTPVQTEQTTQMPQETVDTPTETLEQTPDKPKEFTIPDEYKDKGWAAKVKSEADMFKQLDNLSSLVGKKEILKQPDWEDEKSFNEFVETMRPESKDDYAIPDAIPKDEADFYKDVMHANGVSKKQAEAMFSKISELRASHFDVDNMADRLNQMWGSNVAANTKTAKAAIDTFGGDGLQNLINSSPNESVAIIYNAFYEFAKAHGLKETDIAINKSVGSPEKVDVDSVRSRLITNISTENSKGAPDFTKIAKWKQELTDTYKGA